MERNALIAFVLSLLVLVFWQYFFGLIQTPEPNPPQQEASREAAPTAPPQPTETPKVPRVPLESVSPKSLPPDQLTQVGPQAERWSVSGPLYTMQIVAPGGRIDSFRLKDFRQEVQQDSPPMEMIPTQAGGYLPLAVDLLHHQDWQIATRPFVSQAQHQITLSPREPSQGLALQTEIPGQIRVTKTFSFVPDAYYMDTEIRLQNLSGEKLTDQLGISFYSQPFSSLAHESSYNQSQLSYHEKGTLTNLALKDLAKKETVIKPPVDWVGYENNYFIQGIIPLDEGGYQIVPRVLDAEKGLIQLVYLTDAFEIGANQEKLVKIRFYLGPKQMDHLNRAEHRLADSVDYGWFTFLAKPALQVLNWLYHYTRNYGVAIILITILIKIIFWPLTQKSYKSMQAMKKIQPKIAQVREKYKDDREKLNQELMNLYKTYKVNPMGGCLPMVIQIPVFFGFYRMLNAAVELRHQPFMLWINDLTAPDRLSIGVTIPYLGDGLPILTLLMGASMFLQQKMTPTSGDPRQEQMMLIMPVVFTFFFINFPSGLVLYWLVNNVLSIAQQYWINRHAS